MYGQKDFNPSMSSEDNLRAALRESNARQQENSFRVDQGNKNVADALHNQEIDQKIEYLERNLVTAFKRIEMLEEERKNAVKWALSIMGLAIVAMGGVIFNALWKGGK